MIVHMVSERRWREYVNRSQYRHPSLDTEGFVHCSDPEQVVTMANARDWPAGETFLLLCIDSERLSAEVVYEGEPVAYPHVYGQIPREAIVDVVRFSRDAEGNFVLPEKFRREVGA